MADTCCSGDNVLIFACSGGSNVGQISNDAGKKLDQEGLGQLYCLAGVGGDISGIVASSKGADRTIVIDGCSIGCAKATMEKAGVPISCYFVVTEQGIEKGHHFNITAEEIEKTCAAVRQALSG
jgi:uncharacterized metal-binding protein